MAFTHAELMEWQRSFDPLNFNKARGAQYHTAPTVVMPDAPGYPEGVPENSITILFRISEECWLGEPVKTIVENPILIEKEPAKGAKHGPVFILGDASAIAAVPCKENYYWSAQVLTQHQVVRMSFSPDKKRKDGKKRNIVVYATFVPAH